MKGVIVLLNVCMLTLYAEAFSGSGSGAEADPYVITTVEELQEMQDDLSASDVLGNDIDASATSGWNGGVGFVPVGGSSGKFMGTFDGNGYTITGLYINRATGSSIALFGATGNCLIKNVGLIDAQIYGSIFVGALAGICYSNSVIENCWASGQVTISADGSAEAKSGGLAGTLWSSTLSRCYSAVNVTALSDRMQVGSLCGYLRGRYSSPAALIENCYSEGKVTGNGYKVGGLLGDADGTYAKVSKCYSVGKVIGSHKKGLNGHIYDNAKIIDSYWDMQTSGCSSSSGGIGKNTSQMMQKATFVNWDFVDVWDIVENETYPFIRPLIPEEPVDVFVDIKPCSCPNPLNLRSRGILPVAILGSEEPDVTGIDATTIRLAGVAPIRSNYVDVAGPVSDANECKCTTEGPDGFVDLTLKFKTEDIVDKLIDKYDELHKGQILELTLRADLMDGTSILGNDCVKLVGNVPRHLLARDSDINEDGRVDLKDFAELVTYWLESSRIE